MDARLARSQEEPDPPYAQGESAFRIDLERIRFATALSRLADVTQVVTSMATSGVVHNRLTHTIKVTAVNSANDRAGSRDSSVFMHTPIPAA